MKENKLKIITIILSIILVTLVSFFGVYTQKRNKMINSTKEFQYGMDIDSSIVYTLELDDSTAETTEETTTETSAKKQNKEEDKTSENYNKVKDIMISRIKDINKPIKQLYENNSNIETYKIKPEDYQINVNEDNGEIFVTLPKNENSYYLSSLLTQRGTFEVVDNDNKDDVLLNNDDIDNSTVQTYSYGSQTAVSFRIEFNKQGKEKLQSIKEKFGKDTSTTTEKANTETSEANTNEVAETPETETKEVTEASKNTTSEESKTPTNELLLRINGEEVYNAKLDEFITNDAIVLSIGNATTDKEGLKSALAQGQTLISILSNDEYPLNYKIKDSIVVATTEKEDVTGLVLIFTGFIWLIMTVFFVIRYKSKGLLASIAFIGLISILLLIIRYFNITVSTEGIVSLLIVLLLNTVLLDSIVKNVIKENNNNKVELKDVIKNSIKEMSFKIIPLFILAVVFTFTNKTPASSFGMVMFWGLVLIIIYNLFITKALLKYKTKNKKA